MTTGTYVVVKQLPESLDVKQCEAVFRELEPHLERDRPCLVFDLSEVRHLDSTGVELLLRCMEEAMKRNGDLKLAAVSPQVGIILEMTRVDRLFEIFENCTDAVESFHRFSARALLPVVLNRYPELSTGSGDRRQDGLDTQLGRPLPGD